jgi:hypothetical protein
MKSIPNRPRFLWTAALCFLNRRKKSSGPRPGGDGRPGVFKKRVMGVCVTAVETKPDARRR